MYRIFAVLLLCALTVWYAAVQANGTENDPNAYAITVGEAAAFSNKTGTGGEIRMTAAMRTLDADGAVVRFALSGAGCVRHATVVLSPNVKNADGLYTASAEFGDLQSGEYTLQIASASGAVLDYIIAEKGDRSQYEIQGDTITYILSESAGYGSAWFMMQEGEACTS